MAKPVANHPRAAFNCESHRRALARDGKYHFLHRLEHDAGNAGTLADQLRPPSHRADKVVRAPRAGDSRLLLFGSLLVADRLSSIVVALQAHA